MRISDWSSDGCPSDLFLVTKRLKDGTALPDDDEQLRRRSSPHIIQLTLMVRSITTGVAEHETTILVLRHERASGTRTSSVSRLFDGRARVDILLGSLAAVFRQMLSIFRLETLFRSFSDEFDELIRRRRFHDEVRKLAVPSLLEARFRLSLDEKLAKLLLLRKRGVHHDPIDRACRRLFRSEEHTSELQSLMRISY